MLFALLSPLSLCLWRILRPPFFCPAKCKFMSRSFFSFLHSGCPNTDGGGTGTARMMMVTASSSSLSSSSSSSSSTRLHSVSGSNAKTRIPQSSRPIDEYCPAEAADKNDVAWSSLSDLTTIICPDICSNLSNPLQSRSPLRNRENELPSLLLLQDKRARAKKEGE